MIKYILLSYVFFICSDICLGQIDSTVHKSEQNFRTHRPQFFYSNCSIIEKDGKFYELEFWPDGAIKKRTRIELYFADGVRYETNLQTGANEAIYFKFPAYRLHGVSYIYDTTGKVIVEKKRYRHGVLKGSRSGVFSVKRKYLDSEIEEVSANIQNEVLMAISKDISEAMGKWFSIVETNRNVKIPAFENVDSVLHSVGYVLYGELVSNSKIITSGEVFEHSENSVPPYLLFSNIVFDNLKNHCIVSYVKYYGPLASEEVCAIYRVHRKYGHILSVDLLWSQSLSVS